MNHPPCPMRENTEPGKSSHGEPSARPVAFLEAAKSVLGLGALAFSCASSFISTFKGKCVSCPGTVLGNSTSSACPRSLHAEWETATQIAVVQDDCCPGGHRGGLEPHIRGGTWRWSSPPIPFTCKETEAERNQVACTQSSGSGGAGSRTVASGENVRACSLYCHTNQFYFHKQFGSLHNSVQPHHR